MMHAFLITGGTKGKREDWISKTLTQMHVSPFDCIKLVSEEGKQMGVADVRAFSKRLNLAPSYGKLLAGIIEDANLLTQEAQNALLKTLEEPGPHALLILETTNANLLLPTIISRCQVIPSETQEHYAPDELFQCFKTLEQIQKVGVGERIKLIDTIATDRETAKAWAELTLSSARQELLRLVHTGCGLATTPKETTTPIQIAKLLRRLLDAQKQLTANVTPKLVLDNIFLP